MGAGGIAVVILALAVMAGHQATSSPVAAATVGGAGHTPAPPSSMLPAFRAASDRHHVPLSLLLAVAAQESSFQPNARSSAGALGVMQMLPATFHEYARGAPADAIWDPTTEIDAAAADLAANGADEGDVSSSLGAYNHDDAYVRRVEERQAAYQSWIDSGMPSTSTALPWPLRGPITQRFGCTGVLIEPPRGSCPHFHTGVDIGAPDGTAVAAVCAGSVTQAEDDAKGFGIHLRVSCDPPGADFSTLYAHLAARVVQVGDRVAVGQLLGYEGSTGNSTGPHLHFEMDSRAGPVDPMRHLAS